MKLGHLGHVFGNPFVDAEEAYFRLHLKTPLLFRVRQKKERVPNI